jgi:katanin p60 ATPase-containing subunit A1
MDGLSSGPDDKLVVVLAATNFPWDLDDALIRRLEKRIYIPLPDFPARLSLLETLLSEGVQVSENVCLEDVAQKLDGYSGSDISSICRYSFTLNIDL